MSKIASAMSKLELIENALPVVLFGYESSAFTWKARLALKLKQIPYTFVTVPSMMPRAKLRDTFNLTYRKIPVLAIGRDVYCDTSLICDAIEHFFPPSEGYRSLYPPAEDGKSYKPMMRGFASFWMDRVFFRAICGTMPADVWRTSFGQDRAGLIGHKIDADKLEKKIPENMWKIDEHLSMLEPMLEEGPWLFSTSTPSLADIAFWYQLWWGSEISSGRLVENLTSGGAPDLHLPGLTAVFNQERYPCIWRWYQNFKAYFDALPTTETPDPDWAEVVKKLQDAPMVGKKSWLLPTLRSTQTEVDAQCGLREGVTVAIAPEDTGRGDPTIGKLIASSPEEFVIKPIKLEKPPEVDTRIHFPRLLFTARPLTEIGKL